MFRKISKSISTALILTFLFTSTIPSGVFAASSPDKSNQGSLQNSKKYRSKNHTRLGELSDKRNQNTKYYLNSDGTQTADTYINSVNYKDNKGKWQSISNKIISSDEPGFSFSNEANSFKTTFTKDSSSKYITLLNIDNKHKLSWSLEGAVNSSAAKDTYSVTYPNILTDTDLQYQPFSDGLKENIIVKSASAPNVFKFDLKLEGLTPELLNDGNIELKDEKTGENIFVLPKSYMFDNNHKTSNSVNMTIDKTDNPNIYTITVTADENWLKDSSTAFPVTIDPSALTQNYFIQVTSSSGIDTYIGRK